MPRSKRVRSENGIYHVVVQGAGGEAIFGDPSDKRRYLEKALEYRNKFGLELFAYCILDNHAHLIVREGEIDISGFMRRMGVSFSYWYKKDHGLAGGRVYHGRYLSQPVPLWALPAMISYVEKEPVRLGLCVSPHEYGFSSAIRGAEAADSVPDVAEEGASYGRVLELSAGRYGCTADQARAALIRRFGTEYAVRLRAMPKEERDNAVRDLRYRDNLSIHAISEASGFGRGVVQRARILREKNP